MKIYNHIIFIFLAFLTWSCGDKNFDADDILAIEFSEKKSSYTPSESVNIEINNKKSMTFDAVTYAFDGKDLAENKIDLSEAKMGKHEVTATAEMEGKSYSVTRTLTVVAPNKPELYTYEILETYPHDQNAYTQGLEFSNDTLYESTGQFKQSTLRKTNYKTGEVIESTAIGDQYFGEGLTILDDKIYQLTWRSGNGFIYNKSNLKKTGTFVYGESKEGWGLCNNKEDIYKSDGTERIWKLDKETLAEKSFIEVYTNRSKIDTINELEWVDNKIYANIYQKDAIAIVNPSTGAVEGVINLKGLKDKVTQHDNIDVLNGIAYKGEPDILYVTGKNWDKLFKIRVRRRD